MTNIQTFLLFTWITLLAPLFVKFKMLLLGQIRPEVFFKKGIFFDAWIENIVTFIGIIIFLLFIFLDWYKTPDLGQVRAPDNKIVWCNGNRGGKDA